MRPMVFLRGKSGTYARYELAIRKAGGDVLAGECMEDARRCDALLLPGGGDLEPWRYGQDNTASWDLDPLRDREEFLLLELFTDLRRPVLGICRGMQTVNVFFGGSLFQDIPGHRAAAGADRFHQVRTAPSPLWDLYGASAIVNSAHHQSVDRLGAGLRAVQWAPDSTVEALIHTVLPVWAVQWHPERLPFGTGGTADGSRLFKAFLQLVGKK